MTFQELLTHNRGPEWIPPHRLIALDPGETVGLALFEFGELIDVEQIKLKFKTHNWDPLIDRVCQLNPDVLAYEDYKIYPGLAKAHTLSGVPTLKVIGAIEFMCSHNKYQSISMMASTAKGFVSDEKLKDWGFYKKALNHGRDATRLGCHALLFNKELI